MPRTSRWMVSARLHTTPSLRLWPKSQPFDLTRAAPSLSSPTVIASTSSPRQHEPYPCAQMPSSNLAMPSAGVQWQCPETPCFAISSPHYDNPIRCSAPCATQSDRNVNIATDVTVPRPLLLYGSHFGRSVSKARPCMRSRTLSLLRERPNLQRKIHRTWLSGRHG